MIGRPRELGSPWLYLVLIILIGAALRSLMIAHEALWGDEALSLVIASFSVPELFLKPADPTPGLYYLFQKIWLPVGDAAWIVRLPSWLFGILTIPAGYWLGRAAVDARTGAITALFIAILPPLVDYSQEARAYALLLLLETVALAAFCDGARASPARRPYLVAIAAVSSLLAIYTHVTAWVFVGPLALYGLVRASQERWFKWQALVALACFFVAAAIPEMLRIVAYSKVSQFNWLGQPTPIEVLSLYGRMILPLPEVLFADQNGLLDVSPNAYLAVGAVGSLVLLLLLLKAIPEFVRSVRRVALPVEASFALVLLLLIHPLALYAAGIVSPVMMPRTALPFCIGLALAVGVIASRLRSNVAWMGFAAMVAAEHLLFGTIRQKPPYDEIAQTLARMPGLPVLVCDDWNAAPVALHYAQAGGSPRRLTLMATDIFIDIAEDDTPTSMWFEQFGTRYWRARVGLDRGTARPYMRSAATIREALFVDASCTSGQRELLSQQFEIDRRAPIVSVFPTKPVEVFLLRRARAAEDR